MDAPAQPWISTEAAITACTYQPRGLSTLAFGFQTTDRFRISFSYYAHGRLYSGEFQSPIAIPQNERVPITYNPLHPEQNSRAPIILSTAKPPSLITIGITGSILLSLAWLLILRSCH